MSIWGIGLAFLMFWSIAGVGAYLALSSLGRLRRSHRMGRFDLSSVRTVNVRESVMDMINILLLLMGLALVFEGFLFTYRVVFD